MNLGKKNVGKKTIGEGKKLSFVCLVYRSEKGINFSGSN